MTDLPNLAALIEDAICDSNCHADCDAYRGPNGTACASCEALFIANKLTESGRLLPSGGEVSDQFAVLEVDPAQRNGGMVIHWSLEDAEGRKVRFNHDAGGYGGRSYRPGPFGIYRRQQTVYADGSEHYTPWSPVLSDNSEVPNGD